MHRITRSIASALVAGGLVFGLGACSDIADEASKAAKDEVSKEIDKQTKTEYEVTYEVTGDSADSIEFNAGGGESAANPKMETVKNPTLPWKKTVTLRGLEAPAVVPTAVDLTGDGKLTCKITYQGKTLSEESGAGAVSAAGCVAVSPVVG
ncbi:hypothetical protein C6N75_16150 [Streptomyces solincola]|uniref:MmpS family membrane protein n=1 Tax=Streptomyces solincola TaxID=2100817 RepID=A0A2S9PV42_9ACTN|nr:MULTISPECIES: hypothetical protein [Streptomyces]PRH78207.1 hypothetical protein C6N75_16150 [Streptomyces solincola]